MKNYVANIIWIVEGGKMKLLQKFFLITFITFSFTSLVSAASNPYGKYQSLYGITTVRCTWYAWQEAYEHTGVALPGWGNAQTWYNSAINDGYKVGSVAKPNSIAVWSSSDGYGHVGFVVSVEGEYMTTNEGGIVTEENEGIVNGAQRSITADNLIGFIYLDEVPIKKPSNTTSNNNTNKNDSDNNKKSSNTNLSSLTIDIDHFEFNPEVMEYTLEVDYKIEVIHIKAVAEDDKAIVIGAGAKALKVGENHYSIIITAEDKTTKEYKISIIRKNKGVEKKLKEENKPTDFKEQRKYKLSLHIGISIVLIIVVILTIVLIIRRKKGKKK